MYSNAFPLFSMVNTWAEEFKRDVKCPGRPKTATTEELIDTVHEIMMDDRQLTDSWSC